jgi:hypothetical protein
MLNSYAELEGIPLPEPSVTGSAELAQRLPVTSEASYADQKVTPNVTP